jgi:hypothetical protein
MTTPEAYTTRKEPPHRRFQNAYDKYFQELGALHEDTRRRFMDIQFEFARKQNLATQAQDLKALHEAYEEFHRSYTEAAKDTAPLKRHAEAYRRYKDELREAITAADLDDLDSLTLAAVAQSLSVVACSASQFASPPATENKSAEEL